MLSTPPAIVCPVEARPVAPVMKALHVGTPILEPGKLYPTRHGVVEVLNRGSYALHSITGEWELAARDDANGKLFGSPDACDAVGEAEGVRWSQIKCGAI